MEASFSTDKLIYYINKVIKTRRLYILIIVVKDILDINYLINGHLEFTRCYKRVSNL